MRPCFCRSHRPSSAAPAGSPVRPAAATVSVDCASMLTLEAHSARSHPGRTDMQNAANGGYARSVQARITLRKPHEQTPPHVHGKEGVDGSSPSEGSAKVLHVGAFS